jgi:hypothetical protein
VTAILYQLVDRKHDLYRSVFLRDDKDALDVLREHYTSDSEVSALIEGGDIESLAETPEASAYFADRGLRGVEPTMAPGPLTPVDGVLSFVFDGKSWSAGPEAT